MLANRAVLRAAARRTPTAAARPLQRRFASSAAESKSIFPDTEFARERLEVKKHAKDTSGTGVPAVVLLGSINAYVLWNEHWEHWAHDTPLEERTEYPYQNIRTKNFFWGDGDKVSFSWNDKVNYHNPDKA
ncbi:Cytochrome c oxidase subunit 6A, mitochondrial [Ascosphaera acerosa]|nr:Cytochrome c oxidase subunit 6A, mitochondrial [Ascosphaera acerosa]